MYSGALIGTRIQGSGLSFLRTRKSRPIPQWNIQTVRGNVTGRCLWHACKALLAGICLLMIGAAMATVGYYADELAMEDQTQGNLTIKVKNTSRGFHLSNLSYVGPVIMGFGDNLSWNQHLTKIIGAANQRQRFVQFILRDCPGDVRETFYATLFRPMLEYCAPVWNPYPWCFVIVTACVMTFEARDSSAKIVPARFRSKPVLSDANSANSNGHPALQLDAGASWNKASTSASAPGGTADRHHLTHSFQQFSRYLQDSIDSGDCLAVPFSALLKRSPSAPTLLTELHKQVLLGYVSGSSPRSLLGPPEAKRLQVNLLTRQAISVDSPRDAYPSSYGNMENSTTHTDMDIDSSIPKTDSEASLTMDLHLPDCSITLTVKDESKHGKHEPSRGGIQASGSPQVNNVSAAEIGRRETSRRRPLLRQSQVELCDSDTESSPMES